MIYVKRLFFCYFFRWKIILKWNKIRGIVTALRTDISEIRFAIRGRSRPSGTKERLFSLASQWVDNRESAYKLLCIQNLSLINNTFELFIPNTFTISKDDIDLINDIAWRENGPIPHSLKEYKQNDGIIFFKKNPFSLELAFFFSRVL